MLARRVDRYIAVSQAIAERLTETLGWPQSKIEVIRNGVVLDRLQRPPNSTMRERLAGDAERPVVLTVARLDPQKGLDVLVAAAAEMPDARFVVAGEGRQRGRLEADAQRLGLRDRIVFLGHRTDVPDLLAASDLFVLPSLYEGSSLAVLEAMASGKPIISTAVGGTDELLLHGESGLLVPARDAGALASAIQTALSDPSLRNRLGAAARERAANHFSAAAASKSVTALCEKVVADASPRSRA